MCFLSFSSLQVRQPWTQERFISPDEKGDVIWTYETSTGRKYRVSFRANESTKSSVDVNVNGKQITVIATDALEIQKRVNALYNHRKEQPFSFVAQVGRPSEELRDTRTAYDLATERAVRRMERARKRAERAAGHLSHIEKQKELCAFLDHLGEHKE